MAELKNKCYNTFTSGSESQSDYGVEPFNTDILGLCVLDFSVIGFPNKREVPKVDYYDL